MYDVKAHRCQECAACNDSDRPDSREPKGHTLCNAGSLAHISSSRWLRADGKPRQNLIRYISAE